jgi:hypothetical protein
LIAVAYTRLKSVVIFTARPRLGRFARVDAGKRAN